MGLWRRLFSRTPRRARRAEAEGRYRDAAVAYAEANQPKKAARALRFEAARAEDPEVRRAALTDALRWLEPEDPERAQVEGELGDMDLLHAQTHGVHTAADRRRLEQAAARLERAGQGARAATAYELLEQPDEAARCLEQAGEVERLETLLQSQSEREGGARELREALRDHDAALALGARREAREALERGLAALPGHKELLCALSALEARLFTQTAVTFRYGGKRLRMVGVMPVVLGREGLFPLRGPGVSRCHAKIDRRGARIWVEDLDSRNGTTVDGLQLEAGVELGGSARVGLGDALHVKLDLSDAGLSLEVLDGLDRGLRGIVATHAVKLPGLPASFSFRDGYPTLVPDPGARAKLGGRVVVTPIELLIDDRVELAGQLLELEA